MENLTPKQLKRLERLSSLVERGDVSIVEFLMELEEKLDVEIPQIKNIIAQVKGDKGDKPTREDLLEIIEPLIPEIPEVIHGYTPSEDELVEIIERLIPEVKDGHTPTTKELLNLIEPLLPDTTDIASIASTMALEELKPSIPTLEQLEEKLPSLGEKFRDGLELLRGDDRLDISAIKGLENYKEVTKGLSSVYPQYTGVLGIKEIVAGSGVTIDNTNPQYPVVTATGGNGVTVETPTGTVDGSNVSFTVTAEPKWIVSDGVTYFAGAGYTYAALTVTMDSAPFSFIRNIY